ncbi:MAG: polyprenyl synthetase family protein [Candidatus Kapaibacterium sp.]
MSSARPDILERLRQEIDRELRVVLERYRQPSSLYEPFAYSMEGSGKRVRPMMTVLTASVYGCESGAALKAGLAIEIMHTLTLIHDDIMDKAELRRGSLSVHRKWNDATAILCGDVMMGIAYRLLLESAPPAVIPDVMSLFTEGFIDVCEGQAMDLDFASRRDVTIADYMLMIEKKTARLPEIAATIGAVIAGAPAADLPLVRMFAREAGLAFQMQDDLLDVVAVQDELGKTVGQDIVEGKKTYLILRVEDLASSDADTALIRRFYEGNGLPTDEVHAMRGLMERLGVFRETQEKIETHFARADEFLHRLPAGRGRDELEVLVRTLHDRRK